MSPADFNAVKTAIPTMSDAQLDELVRNAEVEQMERSIAQNDPERVIPLFNGLLGNPYATMTDAQFETAYAEFQQRWPHRMAS